LDKRERCRCGIQSVAVLLQNANFKGFLTGRIYQGPIKAVCVPGLNCYSCPGAVGACPIGSLQASLGGLSFKLPYYVLGLLLFFGALLGRAICGFLCPFGFLQDLLHRIPLPAALRRVRERLTHPFKGDTALRKLKYVVLVLLVVVLPICIKLTPTFCEYLCPSGTLAGLFLMANDAALREAAGGLFAWKFAVLLVLLLVAVLIFRPFCKYLCPLGAFYAPFNRFALLRMEVDTHACVGCGACANACKMGVDPAKSPNHSECIRCGACMSACEQDALRYCVSRSTSRSMSSSDIPPQRR